VKDQVLDAFEMLLVGMLFCFFVNSKNRANNHKGDKQVLRDSAFVLCVQ
jgi:hypothetical protein